MKTVAIDYGNKNSKVFEIKKNNFDLILSPESNRKFLNFVSFKEKRYFWDEGFNFYINNYKNNIFNLKLLLNYENDKFYEYTSFMENKVVVDKKKSEESIFININVNNCSYYLEEIISMTINSFKKYLKLKNDDQFCIAIPDDFDFYQRQKILDSFKISNIKNVRLINDSDSISLHYGFFNNLNGKINDEKQTILFLDYGDIHLNMFLVEFKNNSYNIIKKKILNNVGGFFLNEMIKNYIIKKFCKLDQLNIKSHLKILKECDKIKKNFNFNKKYHIHIDCITPDEDLDIILNETDFENIIHEEYEKIRNSLNIFVNNCSYEKVEVVGGSSRLLFFKKILSEETNNKIAYTLNADEALGKGTILCSALENPNVIISDYHFKIKNLEPIYLYHNNLKKILIFDGDDILPIKKKIEIRYCQKDKLVVTNGKIFKNIYIKSKMKNNLIYLHFNLDVNQILNIDNIFKLQKDKDNNDEIIGIKYDFKVNFDEKIINKSRSRVEDLDDYDICFDHYLESLNNIEKLFYHIESLKNLEDYNLYLTQIEKNKTSQLLDTMIYIMENDIKLENLQYNSDIISNGKSILNVIINRKKKKNELNKFMTKLEDEINIVDNNIAEKYTISKIKSKLIEDDKYLDYQKNKNWFNIFREKIFDLEKMEEDINIIQSKLSTIENFNKYILNIDKTNSIESKN